MARARRRAQDSVTQFTVVFDFGGVLAAHHNPVPVVHAEVGGEYESVREVYWRERVKLDGGEISVAEYWRAVCEAGAIGEPTAEEIEALIDLDNRYWGQIAKGSRELIHDLARNSVRIALLSNTNAPFGEYVRSQEWFEPFEFAIISAEEKVQKPDPEIFEILLDAIAHETGGVAKPRNVIFFDDLQSNVDAARTLGIDAHYWPRNDRTVASDTAAEPDRSGWEIAREILTERGVPLG